MFGREEGGQMKKRAGVSGGCLGEGRGGFTLLELIVVMAIIAVLAGIGVPTYVAYIRKAKEQKTLIEARQLRMAVTAMMLENDISATDPAENEVFMSLFWRTLGDEEHPLFGFCPDGGDLGGKIEELSVDEDLHLTRIVYQAPDGSRETWTLEDTDEGLLVTVQ